MIDSSASPTSAELVSARIEEKRLFEAKFLFNKFSATIDPAVRQQLQSSLEKKIGLAQQYFAQAGQLEEQQHYEEAAKFYGMVNDIAIDFPAIEQALQRVTVALKLGTLSPPIPPEREESQVSSPSMPPEKELVESACIPTFQQRWKFPLLFLVVVVSILFIAWDFFHIQDTSHRSVDNSVLKTVLNNATQSANSSSPLPGTQEFPSEKKEKGISSGEIILPRAISPPIVKNISLPGKKTMVTTNKVYAMNVSPDKSRYASGKAKTIRENNKSNRLSVAEGTGVVRVAVPNWDQVMYTRTDHSSVATVVDDGRNSGSDMEKKKEKNGRAHVGNEHVSTENEQGIYIVQPGDSLGRIAQKVYGSSRKWQQLYNLNRDNLSRPSALRIGQKLRTVGKTDTNVDSDPVGE